MAQSGTVNQSGTVKWFNEKLGYGFIECAGSADVFVHFSVLRDGEESEALTQGELVEFEAHDGEHGPIAAWVTRAGG